MQNHTLIFHTCRITLIHVYSIMQYEFKMTSVISSSRSNDQSPLTVMQRRIRFGIPATASPKPKQLLERKLVKGRIEPPSCGTVHASHSPDNPAVGQTEVPLVLGEENMTRK